MRQQSPGAAGPQPVRQRVEDLPPGVSCRSTTGLDRRNQRREDLPLRIGQIRRVTGTRPAHPDPRKRATTPLPGDLPADRLLRRPPDAPREAVSRAPAGEKRSEYLPGASSSHVCPPADSPGRADGTAEVKGLGSGQAWSHFLSRTCFQNSLQSEGQGLVGVGTAGGDTVVDFVPVGGRYTGWHSASYAPPEHSTSELPEHADTPYTTAAMTAAPTIPSAQDARLLPMPPLRDGATLHCRAGTTDSASPCSAKRSGPDRS